MCPKQYMGHFVPDLRLYLSGHIQRFPPRHGGDPGDTRRRRRVHTGSGEAQPPVVVVARRIHHGCLPATRHTATILYNHEILITAGFTSTGAS